MLKVFSLLFALLFLAFGVLSFFPFFSFHGLFLSIFRVNAWTDVLHVCIGLGALACCFGKNAHARLYFQTIGLLLGIWAVLGFVYSDGQIFSLFANNHPMTWFHVITAVIAMIIGFGSNGYEGTYE